MLSLKAADQILGAIDNEEHATREGGYFKTSFQIIPKCNDENAPEAYEGRYDLGDGEGGLFNHIINFQKYYTEHNAFGGDIDPNKPEQLEQKANAEAALEWITSLQGAAI